MARLCSALAFAILATVPATEVSIHAQSRLQAYESMLEDTRETPVTRVVNLLKEMSGTLKKEMEEDEDLYKKLACWCNNNQYEKTDLISQSEAKIEGLESTIESLTARSAELKVKVKELEEGVAKDKAALGEATELRNKQQQEFHGGELDGVQAIENLKAAILVLSKNQGAAFPQISASLLQVQSKDIWGADHESDLDHSFGEFVRQADLDTNADVDDDASAPRGRFLQQAAPATVVQPAEWSRDDVLVVRRALGVAASFAQTRHEDAYFPSYDSQSGEIVGVLKQMKEEMEGDYADNAKTEQKRAGAFAELRSAKTEEIESGEKMAEQKEDELATTDNSLAEAKEDLEQETAILEENKKFVKNLKETCSNADANFAKRKESRLAEITAVTETIEILTADEARDAQAGTFSLLQVSSRKNMARRRAAAKALRRAALKSHSSELSSLASAVELDAFTQVTKAIDDMVATMKQQQEDEVKKNDWCKSEFQENDMSTMKNNDLRDSADAKSEELTVAIKTLDEEIKQAKRDIAQNQVDLQRAAETRKEENKKFQTTIADQLLTRAVLEKAMDKLATFYDSVEFLQTQKQTPPVPQMEYKKSSGGGGVMQMIEKLIYDTKEITAESKKSEADSQAAYETLVEDTNDAVDKFQKSVVAKSKAKAQAVKDKSNTEEDLMATVNELEDLSKTKADLHAECDYVMKNFEIRQEARSEEVESLQQAKSILNGANLSA